MASNPKDPLLDLLTRWRSGDQAALDSLLAEVLPWLQREVESAHGARPRGVPDSTDLVQTAVLNFLNWGPQFTPKSGAQFRALLKRIAMNALIDQHRRKARSGGGRHVESFVDSSNPLSGMLPREASSKGPSRIAARREDQKRLREVLASFTDQERWLLEASADSERSWGDIAKKLGLASGDAARMRAGRLKLRLAQKLGLRSPDS